MIFLWGKRISSPKLEIVTEIVSSGEWAMKFQKLGDNFNKLEMKLGDGWLQLVITFTKFWWWTFKNEGNNFEHIR